MYLYEIYMCNFWVAVDFANDFCSFWFFPFDEFLAMTKDWTQLLPNQPSFNLHKYCWYILLVHNKKNNKWEPETYIFGNLLSIFNEIFLILIIPKFGLKPQPEYIFFQWLSLQRPHYFPDSHHFSLCSTLMKNYGKLKVDLDQAINNVLILIWENWLWLSLRFSMSQKELELNQILKPNWT